MEIYFVRHTSVDVPAGTCYGNTDVGLKDSFKEEAAVTKSHLDGIRFDAVFTSPLSRAVRLAAYCGYPDAVIEPRVKEYNFGEWEMQDYNRLFEEVPEFRSWCDHYLTQRCPGGESFSDQIARVRSFVDEVRGKGYSRVCVFCHGGVLAIGRALSGIMTWEETFHDIPPYGSVLRLEFSPSPAPDA